MSRRREGLFIKGKSVLKVTIYCFSKELLHSTEKISIFIQNLYSGRLTNDLLPCRFKYATWIYHLSDINLVRNNTGIRNGSVQLKGKRQHTYTHTPIGSLSTPCHGLTAVQGCRIQTTQISCRMRGLQYVGNRCKTAYHAYYPLKHLRHCLFHWEHPKAINVSDLKWSNKPLKSPAAPFASKYLLFSHACVTSGPGLV